MHDHQHIVRQSLTHTETDTQACTVITPYHTHDTSKVHRLPANIVQLQAWTPEPSMSADNTLTASVSRS